LDGNGMSALGKVPGATFRGCGTVVLGLRNFEFNLNYFLLNFFEGKILALFDAFAVSQDCRQWKLERHR
jgi:hypothetical protein